MPRNRKQKAKISKRLAITAAIIGLLTYISKEVVNDRLKELRNSIASAEAQFRIDKGQSTLALEIIEEQEEIEKLLTNKPKLERQEYFAMISRDAARVQEIRAHLAVELNSVSRLIDVLPWTAPSEMQSMRDMVRDGYEKHKKAADEVLSNEFEKELRDPDNSTFQTYAELRLIGLKMAIGFARDDEFPISIVENLALKAARQDLERADALIKYCTWITYTLALSGLTLGLYAAVLGLEKESSESV